MAIALGDLFKTETRDEVLSTILSVASDLGLAITAWQPGQPGRTVLVLVAQKISDTIATNLEAIKGGFLDTAETSWLTLLAWAVYGVTRREAEYATGSTFRVTNAGDANVDVAAGELIVAHSVTNKTYRNAEDLTLVPGVNSGITIVADEVGTDSDAAPGYVTVLVSSQSDLTVTNVGSILGSDEETDAELRVRCRDKLGALSPNGPWDAYAYVVKDPDLCATSVPITRVNVVASTTTGVVTVYVANASGAPSSGDVTICDDTIDEWATPLGTTASAVAATEVTQGVTYQIWIKGSTLTEAQIKSKIAAALATYYKTVPIGGDVVSPDPTGKLRPGILEIIIAKAVEGVVKVTVSVPAADVTLSANEVVKLGTVTGTVTVVA